MSYEQYMTCEYDPDFAKVESLKWDPWVGKNYSETGVFVIGASTDARNPEWGKYADTHRDASRKFDFTTTAFDAAGQKSYKHMTTMFLNGVGAVYNDQNIAKFWSSIAFNNFYQTVVKNVGDVPSDGQIIERSKGALLSTIRILKPKIVLTWTTELWKWGFWEEAQEKEKIGNAIPRIINGNPVVVGMQHPSRWGSNKQRWLDLLLGEHGSKKPIRELMDYLKPQMVN